ncbi:Vacuolar protein sorting-associated protein 17 OS=Schizosaccharomyces pombe (strain 972 / ATCC 24843) GN=vps17 PE=3 SV=1 [Rhizoctonia solani AG-1 IB]|uniref:Vacuolar protein sorting-associated protein 17 n=2 Tax=Thanatephorus cucumeris (strain AG1-IB / isolate 7/3/14) TaxID=1108050 RepID=A0A0B7G5E5_THACB|nr:Vacuolar protein sorting-associated protein 17 OS=Schizosaccharomyces pombe (strain 972 / ATCC 24843) GN=vps17 PE=3 SV=1 [Rhizoctonia solani AG-1 IB]
MAYDTPHSELAWTPADIAAAQTRVSDASKSDSWGPTKRASDIWSAHTGPSLAPAQYWANGTKLERDGQYLRVRITGLDRNRRDIIARIDAQTNLPNFTGSTYRNISRSYAEFQRFAEQISYCTPQTIVPALPLPQTSAPSDEEDDRLVKVGLQRWFTRVCEDPVLMREDEVRSFIESDFGYQPTPRPRRRTGSGFSLMKRNVPDEDEDLMSARLELTRLEVQFFDAAKAIDRLSKARKALSAAHAEMGNKLINVATTEAHPPLGQAIRKLGRAWHSMGDVDQAQSVSECVIVGDALGYQGLNAKSAKETLAQRTQVLEDYQSAVKSTIAKRRQIERLKQSSNIRPEKVDEALEDLEEANKLEQLFQRRVEGISENLHSALRVHARHAHEDIASMLIEHARASVHYEKARLKELEALKGDVERANGPATHGNGRTPLTGEARVPITGPAGGPTPIRGPLIQPPLTSSAPSSGPPSPHVVRPPVVVHGPPIPQGAPGPVPQPTQAQVPAGPSISTPAPSLDPLGGPPRPQSATSSMPGTPNPPHTPTQPHPLAKSMYTQPTHRKLDAREAAAKLANMF